MIVAPPTIVYEVKVTAAPLGGDGTIGPFSPTPVENHRESNWYAAGPLPASCLPARSTPESIVFRLLEPPSDGASSRTAEPDQPEAVMSHAWERKNDRRIELIGKEFAQGGLDADEEAELDRLQDEVFDELDAVIPLPFDALEAMEAKVREIQARIDAEADRP